MRASRLTFALISAALSVLAAAAMGAPSVVFNTSTMSIAPSTTYETSAIVVQNAGDMAQVDLDIVIPAGITLDTAQSGTGLACVTPGTGTSMFFASWNSANRTIEISCMIGASGRVVESIEFTTGASVLLQEIALVKPTNRGSWPAGSIFGSLTLQPPHTVTITSGPTVNPTSVDSGGSTTCSATATDSLGHSVVYTWSASVAGGSFANASAASTTYTAPTNTTGSNMTVTLTCTARCSQTSSVQDVKTVNLTVRPHTLSITAGPSVSPTAVSSGGTVNCSITATDSNGSVTYEWSDGNAGGSFSSATAQTPTYTAPANTSGADKIVTLTCVVRSATNPSVSATRTVNLTVRPHAVTITAGPSVSPDVVGSAGQATVSVTASDSDSHSVTYAWSDGGAGGTFANASAASTTYTAPANNTGTDKQVTLTCTVRCATLNTVTATGTVTLTVSTLPPKTVSVTSSPVTGVSIAFGKPEVGGKTSPQASNFNLSYREGTTGVTLIAPIQSGGDNPRWFSHWKLDNVDQQAGQRTLTFDIASSNRTAEAVYGDYVGDIDDDGDVDQADADLIIQALFGDISETALMDVNQDGAKDANGTVTAPKVDINDARWILQHPTEER